MRDTLAVERIEIAHEGLELDDAYASDSSGDSFWSKFADGVQAGLDIAGLVPGAGEIADGVNALISLGRGDVAGATLSATSMLPIVGDAIGKGGKIARAAIKHGDEVLEVAGKQATEVLETLPLRRLDAGDSSVGRGGGKVNQVHHFATDKNKKYTQAFQDITDKYGLNLDDDWNKALLPHQGRHPNAYHDFILDEMKNIDNIANGNKDIFLDLYESEIKSIIRDNPDMLYSSYWKGIKE